MSTVADQAEYDLPDACMWVLECNWWPVGQLFAELRAGAEQAYILNKPSRIHMPSDRVIDDINQSAHIQRMKGTWEQRNRTIVIFPTPTAVGDEDLEIVYAALHIINDAALGYDTLPDEDLSILADLTLATYLQGRATEIALQPDYAEGLQRVTKSSMSGNLTEMIRQLRKGVEGKYGGVGVAVAR